MPTAYSGTSLASIAVKDSVTTNDREKHLRAKLLVRSYQNCVAKSLCEQFKQPKGMGDTAYMLRYERLKPPLEELAEGADPQINDAMSLTQVTVTLDFWGDLVQLSDRVIEFTSHDVVGQVNELLADNAARTMDREVQKVWLAGTNIRYGDASVTARKDITSSMYLDDTGLTAIQVGFHRDGVSPRGGPSNTVSIQSAASGNKPLIFSGHYVVVTDVGVIKNLSQPSTSFGTFVSVATYNDKSNLYNGEQGEWLGFRFVATNFLPSWSRFGNDTEAVTSGNAFGTGTPTVTHNSAGGSLNTNGVYAFKVTAVDLNSGFETKISRTHTITMGAVGGNTYKVTFDFSAGSASSDYKYNIYFDSVQAGSGASAADSVMKLASSLAASTASVEITAVPSSGDQPPEHTGATVTVWPAYVFGAEACSWLGFHDVKYFRVGFDGPDMANPIQARRAIAWTWSGKAVITNQDRMLRWEVASRH